MLTVSNLTVRTAQTQLLGPVEFSVAAGEALVIMGETGAGKSLIAQSVMGNLPAALTASGSIELNGQALDSLSTTQRQQLWGKQIALLPQEPWLALNPLVRSSIQVAETHHYVGGHTRRESEHLTTENFESLALADSKHKRPTELSGGMCQRVAFAAALAGGAPLLLADEPTKGLDPERTGHIISMLIDVRDNSDKNGALIVVTHDVAVARAIGGKLMVLKDGACVEQGPTNDVLNQPQHTYTQALIAAEPSQWQATVNNSLSETVLQANNLAIGHAGVALIEDFNLTLKQNERIAVSGPSGIGKTTLLDTLAGLLSPLQGSVTRGSLLGRTEIQKIYQDPPAAFARHVKLITSLRDTARLHKVEWSQMLQLLSQLSVDPNILQRRPGEVSGGELQRIAIARALAIKPKILLADEPTSRLDPITQQQTMELLATVCDQSGTAVVLVTHDRHIAANWAARTIALKTTEGVIAAA